MREHYFDWTCPACECKQTDGVNGVQGPFLGLNCERCSGCFALEQLSTTDAVAWEAALRLAENEIREVR